MIPKIIHLCWLSGDEFPDSIKTCLDTWLEHLSGYEVWMWSSLSTTQESQKANGNAKYYNKLVTFDTDSTIWTKQAFEAKKYAFAADYIRLKALYENGGIYLDADVIIYKTFDELLRLPYFIGCDQIRAFEAAVIGCEKGCKWIKDIFDTYEGKVFIKEDGSYDMLELPVRFHHVLTMRGYHFSRISRISELENININVDLNAQRMYVFAKVFFNSRDAVEVHKTKDSFCAHNYLGSWQIKNGSKEEFVLRFKRVLPKWLLKQIYIIGQATYNRNKYSSFQIKFDK